MSVKSKPRKASYRSFDSISKGAKELKDYAITRDEQVKVHPLALFGLVYLNHKGNIPMAKKAIDMCVENKT